MRLGDLLVEEGVITAEQLAGALAHRLLRGGRIGAHLVELGMVTEGALASALASHLHLPAVTVEAIDKAPRNVVTLIAPELAERHRVCPVRRDGERIWTAM